MTGKTLTNKIYKTTMAWAKENGLIENDDLSSEQRKWRKFFEEHGGFNGHNKTLIDLVAQISGIDLSSLKSGEEVQFKNLVAIVPLKNYNSHSYTINSTILCVEGSYAFFINEEGRNGNHMDTNSMTFRIATKEEISNFVKNLEKTKNGGEFKWNFNKVEFLSKAGE